LALPLLLPKPFDEKDIFCANVGDVGAKNEGQNESQSELWILAEPARAAQFGKSGGGWQNCPRLQLWPLFAMVPCQSKHYRKYSF
jgi:hypothetical protein